VTLVAAVLSIGAERVEAQACAGFTDVLASSPFCPNVEWLKNRQITLGCTSATLYCPNDPVSRIAMSAFMNRLGRALTPEVLAQQTATTTPLTIPGESPEQAIVRCVTAESTVAAYPRQALVHASLTALVDSTAVAAWRTFLLVSIDGGTFQNLNGANSAAQRSTGLPNAWAGAALVESMALPPGSAYAFAIGVRRDVTGPATTGNWAQARCQIAAVISNANGTSSPF